MVFAFALMTSPAKGTAQAASFSAAPTAIASAQSAGAPAVDETTKAEDKVAHDEHEKKPADGDDVFRHSPMVQKLANLMHVDVETAARIFEIINFLIIVLGIGIPLFKIMPKVLKNRRDALTKSIAEARAVSADAQARLSAVEAKLANLGTEIHGFRTQVEQDSKGDEERLKASVEEERLRIVQAASQEIQQATVQAQRTLRQFAADLALEHAVKQLKLNEETDRALIDEFIADVTGSAMSGNTNGGKR